MGTVVSTLRPERAARPKSGYGSKQKRRNTKGDPADAVVSTERSQQAAPFSSRVSSISRISPKGQITLPMLVRDRLGVTPGDEVEFFFDGERTVVRPVRPHEDPFAKWIGIAKNVPAGFDPIANQREMRGWDAWDYEQFG